MYNENFHFSVLYVSCKIITNIISYMNCFSERFKASKSVVNCTIARGFWFRASTIIKNC